MAEASTAPLDYRAIKIFLARVVRVRRLNPHLAGITIGGDDLAGFVPIGADQFIYVFVPRPGEERPAVDHDFSWDRWREMPEEERPIGRYYTVRRHRPELSEIDMDFVLHCDGPLSTWAAQAQPGGRVAIWGPRTAYAPDPGARHLLMADETGLPAVGAILEALPPGAKAHAFVEIPGPEAEQQIESAGEVEITWLHRNGLPAGQNTLLIDAVRAADLPEGKVYAWGGGEHRAMTTLRKHLRNERGLDAASVSLIAYWRHHDNEIEPGDE